jgi:hypothetical protein
MESDEFLRRCIHSLLRQDKNEITIIVAENHFNAFSENDFNYMENVFYISSKPVDYNDKLKEAYSLIPENATYVCVIDSSTVAVPCAQNCIANENNNAEILIPGIAVDFGGKYKIKKADEYHMLRNIEEYDPYDFVFSKTFFETIKPEVDSKRNDIYRKTLEMVLEGEGIIFLSQTCFYKNNSSSLISNADTVDEQSWLSLIDRISKIKNVKNRIYIGELVLHIIMTGSIDYAYLQNYAKAITNDIILKKIFESRVGLSPEHIELLSEDEYGIFREIQNKINDTYVEDDLSDIEARIGSVEKDIKNAECRIRGLFCDLDNIYDRGEVNLSSGDYIHIVPQLFRDGRLGMRVALKCLGGWLFCKLHGGVKSEY